MRPLIVGQAPSRTSAPALTGPCGRRLADLCDIPVEEFDALFERVNLVDHCPGVADLFVTMAEAQAAADKIARDAANCGRNVVLLGRAVAAAFEFAQPYLEWCIFRGMFVSACPHPSDVNLWWNDQMNHERAGTFWRQLALAQRRHG